MQRFIQVFVLSASLPVLGARAATIQSNGTGGGDWNTPSSWAGGVVPLPADDVVILDGDLIFISSGTVTRTGSTTINPTSGTSSALQIGLGATTTLINEGALNSAANIYLPENGSMVNRATAVLSAGASGFGLENWGNVLNSGTLTLSAGDFDSHSVGIVRNDGSITIELSAHIRFFGGIPDTSRFINSGVINNNGEIELLAGGSHFENLESGTVNNNGLFSINPGIGENKGAINNSNVFSVTYSGGVISRFINSTGHVVNNMGMTVSVGASFINGFCGRITNNSAINNNGLLSNCGLIDGLTGSAGIDGTGVLDTSCGGGTPDATLMVRVTDSSTSEAVPSTEVYVERVCLPMGTQLPFLDVDSGAARYFLGAVEPAQYEIKAFAPGFTPVSGRLVIIQSGEDRIEDIALTPDPTAVNTMNIDIDVDTGGSLVTNNFQVTQGLARDVSTFQPTVMIDGLQMKLVGLPAGDTTARALIEDYFVAPVNTLFVSVQPRVYEAVTAAVSVGDSGTAVGKLVFAVAPPGAGGIQMNFKKRTEGTAPPLSGQEFTGADHVFGAAYLVPVGGHPDWFAYAVELNAGDYYIAASNSQNTIMSQVVTATIEPSVMGSYSEVPDLNISLPSDDTDGDALPDTWENEKGLNASSAESPNGGAHDKESDGLGNLEEFTLDIHPNVVDTDGDTYADGFERFAGSNPKIADSPPLLPEVYVRYNITEIIKIGSQIMPMASVQTGIGRLANGGTIYIQNAGATPLAEPGALTLGAGNKPMVLRLADPAGPHVRLGSSN